MKVCAFTGHRKLDDTDFDAKKLKKAITELAKNGTKRFLCGMATGFDMLAAQAVISIKPKYKAELVACLPCADQAKKYSENDKQLYESILKECDDVIILQQEYKSGCMFVRDRYMVDNCDVLLCFLRKHAGGTYYTYRYAQKVGREIIQL